MGRTEYEKLFGDVEWPSPVDVLHPPVLTAQIQTFNEGFREIAAAIRLPYSIAYGVPLELLYESCRIRALYEIYPVPIGVPEDGSADKNPAVWTKFKELADKQLGDPEVRKQLDHSAREQMGGMIERSDVIRSAVRAILLSSSAWIWTCFESLAKDSWITLLNANPREFGSKGLSAVQAQKDTSDDLNGKQVSLRLLAKYNYDLSTCLGTVLAEKYDFTGVSGIVAAFRAILGPDPLLDAINANSTLHHLEATRHLVAHRAGIVDDEYRRRTHSPLAVGEKLLVTGTRCAEFANAAATAAQSLLSLIETRINSGTK